jgi:hypothetical protein
MKKSAVVIILVLGLIITQLFASPGSNLVEGQTTTAPAISMVTNFTGLIHSAGVNLFYLMANFLSNLHNNGQRNPNFNIDYIVITPNKATINAGQSQTFIATAYDHAHHGHNISSLPGIVWTINSGPGSYVWNGSSVQITAPGTWTVTATYKFKTATAILNVDHAGDEAQIAYITASINPATVAAPGTAIGLATAYDTNGNSWDISTQAVWSIPQGGDGGIWNQNVYLSNTAGTYTIQAAYLCKTATTSLIVTHATDQTHLDHIDIVPKTASVNAGVSQTYSANAYDTFGNSWVVTPDYTCPNINVVISGSSAYSNAAGSYAITGSYGGKFDTATLTVIGHLSKVVAITVAPKTASIAAGTTQAFTATASDGYNTWDVTASVVWSMDSAAGGSWVQSSGTYTSAVAGTWTVAANINGGVSDTATLTVTSYTVAFSETGLPTGTSWTITLGGKDYTSKTNTINISGLSAQNYAWTSTSSPQNAYTRYVTAQTAGNINVPSQLTQTISYKTEYMVTYTAMGNNSGISTPASEWVFAGGQATGTFPTQTIGITQDSRCNLLADNRSLTITEPTTITANYQTQYTLTVTSTHGTASGAGWYNAGTTATVTINSGKSSELAGTRYIFVAWNGDASGASLSASITMDGPKTVNTKWDKQYLVTYKAAGNAISLNVPFNEWVSSGEVPVGKFLPSALSSDNDTQCIFQSDNRPAIITAPITITGTYETHYKVTFTQKGIASDVKETIMTIQGTPKTWDQLANTTWVTAGSTIDFLYNDEVLTGDNSKSYTLIGVNANSPITVNQPMIIEGSYREQYSSTLYTVLLLALLLLAALPIITVTFRYRERRKKKLMNKTVSR